jgi:hypothetical protein
LGSLEKSRDGMMVSFVRLAIADRALTEPESDGQSDAYLSGHSDSIEEFDEL